MLTHRYGLPLGAFLLSVQNSSLVIVILFRPVFFGNGGGGGGDDCCPRPHGHFGSWLLVLLAFTIVGTVLGILALTEKKTAQRDLGIASVLVNTAAADFGFLWPPAGIRG